MCRKLAAYGETKISDVTYFQARGGLFSAVRHVVCRNFGFTSNYVQTRDLNGSPTAIGNDRATDVGGPSFLSPPSSLSLSTSG